MSVAGTTGTVEEGSFKSGRPVHSTIIANSLEQEIVTGTLPAGLKLDETTIAARFGVSRTPVREAFLTLVSRALAERVPYRGVIVCDLSGERIDQMYEAMGEIEGLCGRLAAGRMTTSERVRFQDQHLAMGDLARSADFVAYDEANTLFHDMIYAGAHNGEITDMALALRLKLAPFRRSQLQSDERLIESVAEHEKIVEAILEHDGVGAERHLRRHLLRSADAFNAAQAARSERSAPTSKTR